MVGCSFMRYNDPKCIYKQNMNLNRRVMLQNPFIQWLNMNANYSSKKIPNSAKSHSSNQWLARQLKDPFVELAAAKNYRCRSAFKLLEINEKHKILKPGYTVIDCGAAPGSWSQVAAQETNADEQSKKRPKGFVISLDLLTIHPISGTHILNRSNFTNKKIQDEIIRLLDGRKVDCVLSDMAPNASGVRSLDQDKIMDLCYKVFEFAITVSSANACLLVKTWESGDVSKFERDLLQFYSHVKFIKPKASRGDSSEKFILATKFLDGKKTEP